MNLKALGRMALMLLLMAVSYATYAQQYKRYTDLPAVYIKTYDGYGITSKTVYKLATVYYVDENDEVVMYDSVSIRGRGNSTWNMAKKPYRIKFLTKEKWLGKGRANAKKWTLLANCGDKTLMRNAVTSVMGEWLGLKFNPAYKFVDLNINGTYYGNYQISDHVEVKKHRVDVEEQDYPLEEGSDITGGYLLEVDGFKDGNCFTTSHYVVPVRIHYPDEDEIDASQNAYIRGYMRDFEAVLSGGNFSDPVKGYRAWVDSISLVNWFIATEVSANIDGYYSTYFYKDRGDSLIYWGPLWDYDVAYGNDTRIGDTSRKLMTDVGYGQTKLWINRMWEDPWFARLVNRRYQEVMDDGLTDMMIQTIDSLAGLLEASQQLNYQKWGINKKMYHERVLYSSYSQYVDDLKSFVRTHNAYLQTAFANKRPPEPTPPFVAKDYYYRIINANTATALDIVGQGMASGTKVCAWSNMPDRESEHWEIVPAGDYYMIINRLSGMALHDPTIGSATATTNVGAQLVVSEPDETNPRQLWIITPQGTSGQYNITNKYTDHTANLNGGNSANGTGVLSYTTDSRNSSSLNRLWYLLPDEEIVPDGIDQMMASGGEPDEYALAYDPHAAILHFGSETPEALTFRVNVYSAGGRLVGTFRADEEWSTSSLSSGIYVVSWYVGGKQRSAKFVK